MNLKIIVAFFLFCIASNLAKAQPFTSNGGRFEVDQVTGCAPFTVSITAINAPYVCNGVTPCEMFYESTPEQLVFTHEYTQPGTYTLTVLFQAGVGTDQITITVTPNTQPEFEIYSCGGNEVQVRITDTNYPEYEIDYNDGSPIEIDLTKTTHNHTFATSGNKTITVRGRNRAGDNCNSTTKTVNAIATLPAPSITQLTVLNNSDIQLNFNNLPSILYRLQIATNSSTSFQPLQNVYEVPTTTINSLNTDNNFYCFRLGAFDPCNNITVYSNTICSSNFDLSVLNNINRLSWITSSTGVSNYSISKNSDPPLNAASTATSLNDPNVICGRDYCYQQTTNYANGSRSISLSKCGTAFSTTIPTVVENISAIVDAESSVELRWTQDPGFVAAKYTITKLVNGSVTAVDSSSTTSLIDNEYLAVDTSCYRISYEDACANKSPVSVEVCPIQLVGSQQESNAINLSWNAYEGWKNGVDHYIVEKFNEQGQLVVNKQRRYSNNLYR